MNGMDPRPLIVGIHFCADNGSIVARIIANLDALTIIFMVPPGIRTLANVCQMSVSHVATAAIISLPLERFISFCSEADDDDDDDDMFLSPPFSHSRYPEDIASAAQYPNAST